MGRGGGVKFVSEELNFLRWFVVFANGNRDERRHAVAQMRAVGVDVMFPHAVARLTHADWQIRHDAATLVLKLDASRGVELVLPLLHDRDETVRWHVCGCLHDFGDERAVGPIAAVLESDPDPQMRTQAAYALGGIASPAAIPALLRALDTDHEEDIKGYSPSWCAATALDEILGTDETRIKVTESLRQLRRGEPDLDTLRRLAAELYERWATNADRPT